MGIVVFGSLNMDLVVRAPRLPRPGETITGRSFVTVPGGKGANQAVACARLRAGEQGDRNGAPGAGVYMLGRVGRDEFGARLREGLRAEGIEVAGVVETACPTGTALITVDDEGENSIVIVPGANEVMGADDLVRLGALLQGGRTGSDPVRGLLVQLEVPMGAVLGAVQIGHEFGVHVVLDPAPAVPLPDELYRVVDILTPNEHEASLLAGFPVMGKREAEQAAQMFLARGAGAVVIKRGGEGAFWTDGRKREHIPAHEVNVVDTTAAGDGFNGALAVALDEGRGLAEAVRWGMAAGALATTKEGAQPSLPRREEVESLLRNAGA